VARYDRARLALRCAHTSASTRCGQGLQPQEPQPEVDVEFTARHLLDPIHSNYKDRVGRTIREQITGSSVPVALIRDKTADSVDSADA
jgi:hypothetical protein